MKAPRREVAIIAMCIALFAGYAVYLFGLWQSSMDLSREYGPYVNVREQIDLLFVFGNVEIGIFGIGLAAVALSFYRDGNVDRALLVYALAGILVLVSAITTGLNAYYQHVIGLPR